jgi:hypothetical protein
MTSCACIKKPKNPFGSVQKETPRHRVVGLAQETVATAAMVVVTGISFADGNKYLCLHGPDGRVTEMFDPFDIFKVEHNGSVRWLRAIADLERAKSYVSKVLAVAAPADYLILNQRTGERMLIQAATNQHDRPSDIPSSTVTSRA